MESIVLPSDRNRDHTWVKQCIEKQYLAMHISAKAMKRPVSQVWHDIRKRRIMELERVKLKGSLDPPAAPSRANCKAVSNWVLKIFKIRDSPLREDFSPYIRLGFSLLQFASLASCPFTALLWEGTLCLPFKQQKSATVFSLSLFSSRLKSPIYLSLS